MSKEDVIEFRGKVIEILPGGRYRVVLDEGGKEIIAYLAGKMGKNSIKVIIGDAVKVELSPYDLSNGRIVWREKIKKD